jgi:hypothetical protein
MPTDQSFLGRGWGFPPEFVKQHGAVVMAAGERDVQESLGILLTTTLGERLMRPAFGCDLKKYLFEPLDLTLETYLKDLVESAILYHEPRIILDDLRLRDVPAEGVLYLELDYTVRATNTRTNYVFPFYKDEGTDIR